MRIAVHNPIFILKSGYQGYAITFLRKYRPIIYVTDLSLFTTYTYYLSKHRIYDLEFVYTVRELNARADVLISLNGISHFMTQSMPLNFQGMRMVYLENFTWNAESLYTSLMFAGVDYIIGESDHGKYSGFFQHYFPQFTDKVIAIPLGVENRERSGPSIESARTSRALMLGPITSRDDSHVYADLWEYYPWGAALQTWKQIIMDQYEEVESYVQLELSEHEMHTKLYSDYDFFIADEGLLQIPPASIFRGCADATVLVCSDDRVYQQYGFEDGVNCIQHRNQDLVDFQEKLAYYLNHREQLTQIAQAGQTLVLNNFTNEALADRLYSRILERMEQER